MVSHGVLSRTEGQDLTEQREGGCCVPTQTQTDSKPPSDKAKVLTSWQTEACTAWCPDILSERANPHDGLPPASGLRTQTLMSAREVPLRLAKTAVIGQLEREEPPASRAPPRGVRTRPALPPRASLAFPFSPHKAHLSGRLGSASEL